MGRTIRQKSRLDAVHGFVYSEIGGYLAAVMNFMVDGFNDEQASRHFLYASDPVGIDQDIELVVSESKDEIVAQGFHFF